MKKIGLIVTVLLTSLNMAFANPPVDVSGIVSQNITPFMQKNNITGIAVELYDHGKPYSFNFGYTSANQNKAVTEDTVFEVGSITKLFTALLLAQAVDAKTVALNESIAAFLPGKLNKSHAMKKITFENLATHTAGFPLMVPHVKANDAAVMKFLANWKPNNNMGNTWTYSNVSIGLLADTLANVSKKPFTELLQEKILTPLHMQTALLDLPASIAINLAQGYNDTNNTVPPGVVGLFPGAWAMKLSARDMLTFLGASLCVAGTPDDIQQAMRLSQTGFVKLPNKLQGLGWEIHDLASAPETMQQLLATQHAKQLKVSQTSFDGNKLIDKTGMTDGFRSYIAIVPNQQTGIVILANRGMFDQQIVEVGHAILQALITTTDKSVS